MTIYAIPNEYLQENDLRKLSQYNQTVRYSVTQPPKLYFNKSIIKWFLHCCLNDNLRRYYVPTYT